MSFYPTVHQRPRSQSRRRSKRVLVTEDNPALRQLMADVLVYEGCSVTEASNAYEMKSAILATTSANGQHVHGFDLVVSDIFMPGKNGLEALTELRRTGINCPFLFVTSFPDLVAYEDIEEHDVQLLPKPFSLKEFRALVSSLLRSDSRTSKALQPASKPCRS